MDRIPFAVWDPISGRSSLSNKPVRMTVHIAVSDSGDIYGPGKGPGATYAHCYNPRDGQLRQHQDITRRAYSDLDGNGFTVGVEHQGRPGDDMTDNQIENDARLFAWLVTHHGVPNRIATWDDTRGLAWHRLGCQGNFGAFSKSNRKTWSAAQTGQRWTKVYGKTCPTDKFIDRIQEIYDRAQQYMGDSGRNDDDMPKFSDKLDLADSAKSHLKRDNISYGGAIQYAAAGGWEVMKRLPRMEATLKAQTAAIEALAKSQGLDPKAVSKAVTEAVERALKDIEITLTT